MQIVTCGFQRYAVVYFYAMLSLKPLEGDWQPCNTSIKQAQQRGDSQNVTVKKAVFTL